MKSYVLYHHPCPDGTGAALAAWLALGDEAEYIGVNYSQPVPQMASGADCYVLDFSYPREVLKDLAKRHWLRLFDHHASAEKDLAGLQMELHAETGVPHIIYFDMAKSGAVCAWEYFHKTPLPLLLEYVQDRDLWAYKLPGSREVSAALGLHGFDFRAWKPLLDDGAVEKLWRDGSLLLRYKNQQVDIMAKNHRWGYFDPNTKTIRFIEKLEPGGDGEPMVPNHIVIMPVANATVFFSEVGERLLELNSASDCAAYYFDRASGQRQWGFRSRPSFDCSVLAKAFGGGGHKGASGFVQQL